MYTDDSTFFLRKIESETSKDIFKNVHILPIKVLICLQLFAKNIAQVKKKL